MTSNETAHPVKPLVVRSHVTPWGFLVALPLALAFAYVGALSLDHPFLIPEIVLLGEVPFWLSGVVLLAFALLLFLIGIAELAAYLKPSVEVVIDHERVTTWGVMGERRFAWKDVVGARIDEGQLVLSARGRTAGKLREARMHFSRLQVDPAVLVRRILAHRPDIRVNQRPA